MGELWVPGTRSQEFASDAMNAKSTNQHARQETTDSRKPKETGAGGLAITALAIAAIAVAGYWLWRNVTTGMKGEWIESEETTTTPPDAREQASPTHPFASARRDGENGGDELQGDWGSLIGRIK